MTETKKYHFIGIGGIGMSGLARILLEQRKAVSGSDLSSSETTEQLKELGATIAKGHEASHVAAGDTVVFNSQIQKNNPEYVAALSLKCPLMHRSDLLAHLMEGHQTLAVAGTHGKTTTAALLTTLLIEGGWDPTFAIGGMCAGLNGRSGKGRFFVAEADESDGTFLKYHPHGGIVTNIESEHLDHYQNLDNLKKAFRTFFSQIKNKELLFFCGDDPLLKTLTAEGYAYGFGEKNDLRISNFQQEGWSSTFDIAFKGKIYQQIQLSLVGEHNALNAAAVFGLGLNLGLDEKSLRKALKEFHGVGRRCEKKGERGGVLFLDDYGHHPTEVAATLKGIKQAVRERRLIVVFQPHRYTRTRDLMDEFTLAFEWADELILTDIYPAMEPPIPGVTAQALLASIQAKATIPCRYIAKGELVEAITSCLMPHDVLLTLGAGDVTHLHRELLSRFRPKKFTVGLIFGGNSCEHEISIRSSRFVAQSLNRELYDISFFGIDKRGGWIVGSEAERQLLTQKAINSPLTVSLLDPQISQEIERCDLFLPILHGTHGEDGTLQGFFEMLGKPYVGPDHCSAAVCMDKILTKRVVSKAGVPTPRDVTFSYHSWLENREMWLTEIKATLPLPVYVKPVHLGSSIGVTPVFLPEKLEEAIDSAFRFDVQVMIEEGKVECRELEFAVVGNAGSFFISVPGPGEKLAAGTFVDYEKKYGSNAVKTTLQPDLPAEWLEKGKEMARRAYEAIGCTGMTRVDFLLDSAGEFWLFEMNTIPGLQQLSLFPKIWSREGVLPDQLFDRLIILALARYRQQTRHYQFIDV